MNEPLQGRSIEELTTPRPVMMPPPDTFDQHLAEMESQRMRAKLWQIKQLVLARKHDPVQQTGEWLRSVVQGYFNYHAVPGNGRSMGKFREQVARCWRLALRRRSQKSRMTWDRFRPLAQRWIPVQRVLHPFPRERFDATHPR